MQQPAQNVIQGSASLELEAALWEFGNDVWHIVLSQ
jgi:hypothetical protein